MLPEIPIQHIERECVEGTPARIIEQIREHRSIAMEAIKKIEAEGTVVRTLKGDVIAHPAIRIHAEAAKAEAALLKEWGYD